jgi:hypothetical protein
VSEWFTAWLDGYRTAWENRDPVAVARLFSDDALYYITPFSEPLRGRENIVVYWEGVARTQQNVSFDHRLLSVQDHLGIARWTAAFQRVPSGKWVKLDGIFVVEVDAAQCCTVLREWWHSTSR